MPFPFLAALSICSDIDECDRRTFLDVHQFVNDPHNGLGLPIADSFFAIGSVPNQLAYFLNDGRTAGPDAELIAESIRAGLIDSIHSWGDFNDCPPEPSSLKNISSRLTEDFAHRGLQLKIWINHGNPNNRQNLRARLQSAYAGDDPGSPFFTLDLVRTLGIRYYWLSELVDWPLSGRLPPVSLRVRMKPTLNQLKNLIKTIMGRRRLTRTPAQITELCQPTRVTDGTVLMAFNRHLRRFREPSTRHTLRYTLAPAVLDELLAEQGYMILYTHLGRPRFEGGDLFPAADILALQHLAELYRQAKIWVAPTAQLLDHWFMTRYLEWQAMSEGDKLVIQIRSIHDPVIGSRTPDVAELAGLCFYVPYGQETIFRVGARDQLPKVLGFDRSGGWVVGFETPPPPETDFLHGFH
ncbi:MAG: hypothetical protein AB2L21_00175 [Anaerolineaceae bacterium]